MLSLEGDHSRWPAEFVISDLTGLSGIPDLPPLTATYIIDPADGKIPYQPWAAAKRQEFIADMLSPTKREHVDPFTRGFLPGVPRINYIFGRIQILQAPGYVVMLYEQNSTYRVIQLDGRPHIGENVRLLNGDSRGRWDGNTLVVDVTNQDARTWLDWLSFHGDRLHVVERWMLAGPDRIDYRATLTDPTMFTQPWTIAFRINRFMDQGYELWENPYSTERDVERILRGGGLAGRRKE